MSAKHCADAPTIYVMIYLNGKRTYRALHSMTPEHLALFKEAIAAEEERRVILKVNVLRIWQPVPTGVR